MSESLEQRWRRLQQEYPYVAAFHDGFPWKLMPLYVTAAISITWMTILTLWIVGEHAPTTDMTGLVNAARAMIYVLLGTPFVYGFSAVYRRWKCA